MFKRLLAKFKKTVPAQPQIEHTPWTDADALTLFEFLKTDTGDLFLKKLRSYHLEVTQWATDVSMENYDNMKYRACVAHGVKLKLDKILEMSRAKPGKNKEEEDKKLDQFFSRRMAMFKSDN
jgi:hypothetical protein